MSEGAFEAKKYALRQSKDGVVVSFVVHPNDVNSELLNLPVGAQVMIGWSECGETPEACDSIKTEERRTSNPEVAGSSPAAAPAKAKTPFKDMSLPQQAGIRCGDPQFAAYIVTLGMPKELQEPAEFTRWYCGVKSRTELSTNREAANKWRKISAAFESWLTDQQYAGAVR